MSLTINVITVHFLTKQQLLSLEFVFFSCMVHFTCAFLGLAVSSTECSTVMKMRIGLWMDSVMDLHKIHQ